MGGEGRGDRVRWAKDEMMRILFFVLCDNPCRADAKKKKKSSPKAKGWWCKCVVVVCVVVKGRNQRRNAFLVDQIKFW